MSYYDLANIDDSQDSDFPLPHLDPPQLNNFSKDSVIVERHMNANPHWSEMPPRVRISKPTDWYEQDNSARSPLDQDWEDIDGNLMENKYE